MLGFDEDVLTSLALIFAVGIKALPNGDLVRFCVDFRGDLSRSEPDFHQHT